MPSPPVRAHSFYVNNTPTTTTTSLPPATTSTSSLSSLQNSRSSLSPRLPSLLTSSSYSAFASLHNSSSSVAATAITTTTNNNNNTTTSATATPKLFPWSSPAAEKADPTTTTTTTITSSSFHTQPTDSRRSVRWSDSRQGKTGGGRWSHKKTPPPLDPQQMWERYTQTVRPPFRLHEPGAGRLGLGGGGGGGEGGGGGRGRNGRRLLGDVPEEDGRYVMKMSLPCPRHSGCCFCVYSRQLGPVRIYFSSFRQHKVNQARSRASALRNGGSKDTKLGGVSEEKPDQHQQQQQQQQRMVFLKAPWMTCSAPSGEVIVPELPPEDDDDDDDGRRHHGHHQCHWPPAAHLPSDLKAAGKLHEKRHWGKNHHGHLDREHTKSKFEPWLRNSAPPEVMNQATAPLPAKGPLGKLRLHRSITFWDEDIKPWTNGEVFPQAPKTIPKSPNSVSVRARKENRFAEHGVLNNSLPVPCRDLSSPVRLLAKRRSRP